MPMMSCPALAYVVISSLVISHGAVSMVGILSKSPLAADHFVDPAGRGVDRAQAAIADVNDAVGSAQP